MTSGLRLTVGENAAVTLVMQVGATEAVTVSAADAGVNVRTGELSYLVDLRTMEGIPINGRNYTDLMSLQPGVTPFAHRDNGSVVAHGLAMSVNGQDPRANVYLLDGTLLNDFTNGPAGSAAGTALGMDTVREFRVESNTYSAEFGRNVGGQINAITKSGTNRFAGSAFEFHRNDALDARNYFDVGDKPGFTRNQFGGTVGGPIRAEPSLLLRRLRSAAREPRPDDPDDACPTTTRGRACCRPGRSRSIRRSSRISTSSRAPTARTSAAAWPATRFRSISAWISTSSRRASTRVPGTARSSSGATRSTTPISGCRPTTRSFRARSSRATSS